MQTLRAACGLVKPFVDEWQWQRAWACAFDADARAVAWWWHLTERRPGEFDDRYREAQRRFFHTFSPYDHDPNDLLTAELIARSRVLARIKDEVRKIQDSEDGDTNGRKRS